MYNILICDDEKDIVNALKIYLKDAGYTFFTAADGLEALDVLRNEEIHLILMDNNGDDKNPGNQQRADYSADGQGGGH